jgi:hypothetical protein
MKKLDQAIVEAAENLAAIEAFKQSRAYTLLVEPLQKELDGLKHAYKCKTLQEMARLDGLYEGLSFITDLLKQYEDAGDFARERQLAEASRQARENQEIDSTEL